MSPLPNVITERVGLMAPRGQALGSMHKLSPAGDNQVQQHLISMETSLQRGEQDPRVGP